MLFNKDQTINNSVQYVSEPYQLAIASRIAAALVEDSDFWNNSFDLNYDEVASIAFRQTEALIAKYVEIYGGRPMIRTPKTEEMKND